VAWKLHTIEVRATREPAPRRITKANMCRRSIKEGSVYINVDVFLTNIAFRPSRVRGRPRVLPGRGGGGGHGQPGAGLTRDASGA